MVKEEGVMLLFPKEPRGGGELQKTLKSKNPIKKNRMLQQISGPRSKFGECLRALESKLNNFEKNSTYLRFKRLAIIIPKLQKNAIK